MDRSPLLLLLLAALFWAAQGLVRRNRRVPGWRTKDLFGHFQDVDYSPLSHVPYSSYLGEVAPFWSFRTNGQFQLIDHNAEPRIRARAAFEKAWERLGVAQDRIDTASSDVEFVSEHERPRDVPTRQVHQGQWAKGELPDKKVDLGFVPVQIYSQTRRIDAEEHLPRERATEDAETEEEKIAAPRLREVLRNTKLHEVYEEEGYEDQGYDHGGYNHHGVQVEDAVKDEETLFKKLQKPNPAEDSDVRGADSIGAFSQVPLIPLNGGSSDIQSDSSVDSSNEDVSKMEIGRIVVSTDSDPQMKPSVRSDSKQNLTIYIPEAIKLSDRMDIAESRSGSGLESRIVNSSGPRIAFPGKSSRRQYTTMTPPIVDGTVAETKPEARPQAFNLHQVASYLPTSYVFKNPTVSPAQFSSSTPVQFASTINTYASLINQNFSSPHLSPPHLDYLEYDSIQPFYNATDDYIWAQSSVHEKKVDSEQTVRPVKIEDNRKTSDATTTKSTLAIEISSGGPKRHSSRRRVSTRSPDTSTQSMNTQAPIHNSDDSSASPTRSSRKSVTNTPRSHKVYSNFTRGSVKYNPEDDSQWTPTVGTPNIRHPSLPIDNGEKKEATPGAKDTTESGIMKQVIKTPMLINMPTQEQMMMIQDPAANAKYVEQLTLAHFSVPANLSPSKAHIDQQDERLKELAKQLNSPHSYEEVEQSRRKRNAPAYDKTKYPHYASPPGISKDSALKYATNPEKMPKKTYGGMEFYDSKDSIKCSDPPQPKNVTPTREEDGEWKGEPKNKGPRVRGVGTAIDCYKRKYFGRDPLDNPFFKEDKVQVTEDAKMFEKSLPSLQAKKPDTRVLVIGQHPSPNLTAEIKIAKPIVSTAGPSRSYLDVTFTTPPPANGQYQVYEDNHEQADIESHYKYKHYYSLLPGKSQYPVHTKQPHNYIPQSLSTYSIINHNKITPVHYYIPPSPSSIKLVPFTGAKKVYRGPVYSIRPAEYIEKRVIIRKRETTENLWDNINPLKWWWPSLFDSRRNEPRFKRNAEDYDSAMPNSEEIDQVGREMLEMLVTNKPATSRPITLAEFKAKLNISESNKKTTSRLTGGFLNRNPDITDVMEILVGIGPTDSTARSTAASSTAKPKVVFPRAKLPRRKAYPPSKKPGPIADHITTEGTTTTTTSTLPPPTTTRMYKPKRVIKKNYGKGPFDVFTILKTQQEVKATQKSMEVADSRSDNEHRIMSSESENDTLTYMVNPATGQGSWTEQRKWKPKRKRPNTPSVYSYRRNKNNTHKKPRDIPDPHKKAYVYGLMSKLLHPYQYEGQTSSESDEESIRRTSSEEQYSEEHPVTRVKPPPKFILEPDKRKYYYAKVR